MNKFLEKRIAVVGVSGNKDKYGYRIFQGLIKTGVHVWGVNPRGGEVLGRKLFASLKDIGEPPDLVITVVKPEVTEAVVDECRALGVKEIWMQPGSESDTAVEKAKGYGISVVHHACFMAVQGIW